MAIGLKTQIWNNNLRSLLLLAAYPFILFAMLWAAGAAIGVLAGGAQGAAAHGAYGAYGASGIYGLRVDPVAVGNHVLAQYWPLVTALVAVWFIVAWFFQNSMIRMVSHSAPVTRAEEPALYNLLENLCISRGLKMPRLEIIESPARNAFASGVDDRTYSITVTRGLLQALQPDEVEAVLGHELSHIINRDVRLLMVTVIFTGMVGFAAQIMWTNLRYGFYFSRGNGERRGNPVLLYLAILAILGIGYLASLLARLAISRRREYMADAGSVELTHNPEAMMRALERIAGADRIAHVTDDVSMMCTENSKAFLGLFATHPPIGARIRAISELTQTPIPPPGPQHLETETETTQSRRNPWQ